MVEEKKELKFKLRVTKKNMIQVVDKYFPEKYGKIDKQLNHCTFKASAGSKEGRMLFYDSSDKYWHVCLYMRRETPWMWFQRWDEDAEKWLDCESCNPDIEYLDLLGMLVKC